MHRFEALKLIRSWRPAVALAATALFLLLMLLGFYTYARTETGGRAEFRYTFENESYFNGLTFALYAFHFGVLMVVPVFAACEGGAQLAGETAARTVQLLLARPISRSRIFLAKLAVSALYLSLLVGLLLAAAMLVGLGTVGWGDLDLYPGVLQMAERHQHLPQPAALRAFLLAWPTAVVAMSAPLALGFLLAAWSRNPVNAVAAAIAVYVVLYVTSEIHLFRVLRPWLFTTYLGYWRGLFREQTDWPAMMREAARLLAFTCGFLAVAHYRFCAREEV